MKWTGAREHSNIWFCFAYWCFEMSTTESQIRIIFLDKLSQFCCLGCFIYSTTDTDTVVWAVIIWALGKIVCKLFFLFFPHLSCNTSNFQQPLANSYSVCICLYGCKCVHFLLWCFSSLYLIFVKCVKVTLKYILQNKFGIVLTSIFSSILFFIC